jgi:hypothetical protein
MILKAVSYLLFAAILGFLGFCAWFASVWGFSPFVVLPLTIIALPFCVVIILAPRLRQTEDDRES